MNILVRADGSKSIGSGHVMRCLAMAREARSKGGRVLFASAELSGDLAKRLQSEGVETASVGAGRGSPQDSRAVARIATRFEADWIVVDGYPFDGRYRRRLRDALDGDRTSILLVDDLGGDGSAADVVLNQNLHATPDSYPGVDRSRLLLGGRYLLLRPEFERFQGWERPLRDQLTRLLVVAGADPNDEMAKVVGTLAETVDSSVRVDVVGINPVVCHQYSPFAERFQFHGRLDKVSPLMALADAAVSTAGSLCWELLSMQLPALLVPVADNQRPGASYLAARPGYRILDTAGDSNGIADWLELVQTFNLRSDVARRGRELIDGRGARRVVRMLRSKLIRLRQCRRDDCRLLWEWANDPVTRRFAFHPDPISWETHQRWFRDKMADDDALIFIGEHRDGRPLGQVRFDAAGDGEAVVSISVAPESRSGGFGWLLLRRAIHAVFDHVDVIRAYVKPANKPSMRLFESLQFNRLREVEYRGSKAVHFAYHTTDPQPAGRVRRCP